MRYTWSKIRHKIMPIILIGCIFFANAVSFADNEVMESSVTENTDPIYMNLLDLRESFIKESKDLRDIQKNLSDMGQAISNYDASFYFIALMGEMTSGTKDQRQGSYYEYAYPNFVQMENLKAQSEVLNNTKTLVETNISFAADQLLSNYSILNKQIELYDQMIEKTEKTYKAVVKKLELGNISKTDAEVSRIELENLKFDREKLALQVQNIEFQMKSLGGLMFEREYTYQAPVFTDIIFSIDDFASYYESAKQVSMDIRNANRQMSALENEKKYIDIYKQHVLKSDILDFNRRYEEGKRNQEKANETVYKTLRSYLSEYNRLLDEVKIAEIQIKYDQNFLAKLKQMEDLGQIVDTTRQSYAIKVFQSEIKKMSLENDRMILGQKIDLLVNYGLKL